MALSIIIALFLSFSVLIETLGVWFRFIGAVDGKSATGYSAHVRVATLGRFFILISAPLLGLMIDRGVNADQIAFVGFLVYCIVFCALIIISFHNRISFVANVYKFFTGECVACEDGSLYYRYSFRSKMMVFSSLSFLFTSSGILLVNYFASIFIEYRAMIVQMSAFITMAGTLFHVFMVDPMLARSCDINSGDSAISIYSFVAGRVVSSLALALIFLLLIIIL